MKTIRHRAVIAIIAALVGCGDGSEGGGSSFELPTNYYGSIALNQVSGASGIATNYTSQSSANSNALKVCGTGCVTVLEFGNNQCGALAASGLSFGWASNSNQGKAEGNSIAQCVANNGKSCKPSLSQCNG